MYMAKNSTRVIGIDARFYGEAGPGRYVKAIIQHLEKADTQNQYLLFFREKGFNSYTPTNPNFKKVLTHYKWYSFEEQIFFLIKLLKYKLDLLYVPHFNIPILYPKKLVTAIPDIIMHTFSTEKETTRSKLTYRLKKLAYYVTVLIAVIRSKKVIVPSNTVRKDFLNCYKFIPPTKYVIAYEGVDPTLLTTNLDGKDVMEKYGIKTPFLLYVSSMYRHKNVENLIKGFEILKDKFKFPGQLVLVGKKDHFSQEIAKKVKDIGFEKSVIMPGIKTYVTDEEITALRKSAAAYVFPSLMEGFSLTPLESMALGLPTVISDIPCHREIYRDCTMYFDPHKPEMIAEKINIVLNDQPIREKFIEKGYELVKKYDWQKTAEITLNVFEKALGTKTA